MGRVEALGHACRRGPTRGRVADEITKRTFEENATGARQALGLVWVDVLGLYVDHGL